MAASALMRSGLATAFELEESDVLLDGRQRLDHPDDGPGDMDDPITICFDQLPLLTYPFGPIHQRPAPTSVE